jgi:hypothetical protein
MRAPNNTARAWVRRRDELRRRRDQRADAWRAAGSRSRTLGGIKKSCSRSHDKKFCAITELS